MSDPFIVQAGQGKSLNVVGDLITFKVRSDQTDGAYSVVEEVSPPQGGPRDTFITGSTRRLMSWRVSTR